VNRFTIVLITLIAALLAGNVWACGDSLYRVYTAPLPGSVLVYGQTEGAKMLAEALAESGHNVTLADSELDLSLEMSQGQFYVVIAADRGEIKNYLKAIHKTLKAKA